MRVGFLSGGLGGRGKWVREGGRIGENSGAVVWQGAGWPRIGVYVCVCACVCVLDVLEISLRMKTTCACLIYSFQRAYEVRL